MYPLTLNQESHVPTYTNTTTSQEFKKFDDTVDWSEQGQLPAGSMISPMENPFLSAKGNEVEATHKIETDGNVIYRLRRVDQSADGETGFRGNFSPDAKLISTVEGEDDGPLTLRFGTPVAGVGSQFMGGTLAKPFTAVLRVYERSSNGALPAHTVEVQGVAGPNETPLFIGVISDTAAIVRAEFDTKRDDPRGFAIDSLRLLTDPSAGG